MISSVWLVGDSILNGYALGRLAETLNEPEVGPLWPLRGPASVINLILGREAAKVACATRLPNEATVELGMAWLAEEVRSGAIRPGDAVVFLDVGEHSCDPDAYERLWTKILTNSIRLGLNPYLCEGFDDLSGVGQLGSGSDPTAYRHAELFGSRSHNDAVRAAADGRATFIPLHNRLQAFNAAAVPVPAFAKDHIHLSVWGQFVLVAAILEAIGAQCSLASLLDFVRTNWAEMRPWQASRWTEDLAAELVLKAFYQGWESTPDVSLKRADAPVPRIL